VLATTSPTVLQELADAQLADDRRWQGHVRDVEAARVARAPRVHEERATRPAPSWWPRAGLRWHAG
jgi:hypothetical protein